MQSFSNYQGIKHEKLKKNDKANIHRRDSAYKWAKGNLYMINDPSEFECYSKRYILGIFKKFTGET